MKFFRVYLAKKITLTLLLKDVLHELPGQVLEYMKSKGSTGYNHGARNISPSGTSRGGVFLLLLFGVLGFVACQVFYLYFSMSGPSFSKRSNRRFDF